MNNCSICLNNDGLLIKTYNKYYTKCRCNFVYHHECISKWKNIRNNCPICKKNLYNNQDLRYHVLIFQYQEIY